MAAANQIAGKNDSVPLSLYASFTRNARHSPRETKLELPHQRVDHRADGRHERRVLYLWRLLHHLDEPPRPRLVESRPRRAAVPSTSAEEAYTGRGGGGGGASRLPLASRRGRRRGLARVAVEAPERRRVTRPPRSASRRGERRRPADAARPRRISSARSTAFSALSAAAAALSALSAIDESVVSTLASNAFARSVSTRDARAIAVHRRTNRSVCSARSDRRSSTRFDTNSSLSASMRARRSGSSSAPGTRTPACVVGVGGGWEDGLGPACFVHGAVATDVRLDVFVVGGTAMDASPRACPALPRRRVPPHVLARRLNAPRGSRRRRRHRPRLGRRPVPGGRGAYRTRGDTGGVFFSPGCCCCCCCGLFSPSTSALTFGSSSLVPSRGESRGRFRHLAVVQGAVKVPETKRSAVRSIPPPPPPPPPMPARLSGFTSGLRVLESEPPKSPESLEDSPPPPPVEARRRGRNPPA